MKREVPVMPTIRRHSGTAAKRDGGTTTRRHSGTAAQRCAHTHTHTHPPLPHSGSTLFLRKWTYSEEISLRTHRHNNISSVESFPIKLWAVVFLSCPLVKKHADLSGSFLYSQSTMNDMYSTPTNRTELSIPTNTKSLA